MLKKGLLALATTFLAGCLSLLPRPYYVQISGISGNQQPATRTYFLIPGNQGTLPNDLQFKEFARYAKKALAAKGFREADLDKADLIIGLAYGISDPKTVQNLVSSPVYGQIDPGGQAGPGAHIYFAPSYGIRGYRYSTETTTEYTRFIGFFAISAAGFTNNQTIEPVWQTIITSSGSGGDLRAVFPIILAAAVDYIGINTTRAVSTVIYDFDSRVTDMKE